MRQQLPVLAPGWRELDYPVAQPTALAVPFVWSALNPVAEQEAVRELVTWVGWLAGRYRLDHRVVPDCWPAHPELVEELSALHLAWLGAFARTSAADAPLGWHERFAHTSARLSEWTARTGCRPGAHRDR
ncbi:hypothetical protein [Cellulomonas endophytica]|uniref:hypothetical protein n=1 Tax=Cellulomonas endophytica TaxID=2494735 RepID=UPI001011073B|nr:hypothetical protein [Cellulomonas endophytica]